MTWTWLLLPAVLAAGCGEDTLVCPRGFEERGIEGPPGAQEVVAAAAELGCEVRGHVTWVAAPIPDGPHLAAGLSTRDGCGLSSTVYRGTSMIDPTPAPSAWGTALPHEVAAYCVGEDDTPAMYEWLERLRRATW